MSNILEVKTTSPDYKGLDPEQAAQDFRNRIRNYEKVYETIDEDEKDLTYLKLMNVGKQCIINRIQDYLQSRVVYYLMNLHIKPRSIWLSRVSWMFSFCIITDFNSTANPSSIWMGRLVAMQLFLNEESYMPRSFQNLFFNQSVYVPSIESLLNAA
jgi:hypothetical protein